LLSHPEDGGSKFLSNADKLLPTTCHVPEGTAIFFAIFYICHPTKRIYTGVLENRNWSEENYAESFKISLVMKSMRQVKHWTN
jgi:hypothetical protein